VAGAFDALVALHAVCALVGFGSVAMTGVYGGTTRRVPATQSVEEARRWFARPNRAKWALLAVPVFGAAALVAGHRTDDFSRAWVPAALVVWVAAAALVVTVIAPAEARLRRLLAAVPGDRAASAESGGGLEPDNWDEAVAAGRALLWATTTCDVGFAIALGLMVWQP
jgi:peptidoglycan/LPS O-acetylase OafA/YrhL